MKRWSTTKRQNVRNKQIDTFLGDVIAVCKNHGLSISHEDTYGAFVVERYSDKRSEWLSRAADATEKEDA